ncbi:MAG: RecX family transcriptional regulator [Candidatus Izimaplasma sp.]|nr:RecX family transcriptional regulator [Candidatus Izimaplasma bacterium]
MIKLTKIVKNKNDFTIHLEVDGKPESKRITPQTVINYNLLKPKTLTEEDYRGIQKDNIKERFYNRALTYINYKPRTTSEVRTYLSDKTDQTVVDGVIAKLIDNHFLDDDKYVKEFIAEEKSYKLIGPKKLKAKLFNKGLSNVLINKHLKNYTKATQESKIKQFLTKETRNSIKKPYIKAKQSIKRKLHTKGFDLAVIDSVINEHELAIKDCIDERMLLKKELENPRYFYKTDHEKQKVKRKLLNKGYDYELLIELLD